MAVQKLNRLVVSAMLLMMFVAVRGLYIDDDDFRPDAPKSEAQMYFDTIPEESELEYL
jgi:hypothetical protein